MSNTNKLSTPVQYERGLDGLNEIRPLVLDDTVRRVVSLPIINVNPVDKPRIAKGKVLRCTQGGAVLGTKNRYYTNYEEKYYTVASGGEGIRVTFSQRVGIIQLDIVELSFLGYVVWKTLPPAEWIKYYDTLGIYYLPIVGTEVRGRIYAAGEGSTTVYFRGFY